MHDSKARYGDKFLSEYEEEKCADIQENRNQEGQSVGDVIEPAEFLEYQRQAETEQNQSNEQVVDAVFEKRTECLLFQGFGVELFHFLIGSIEYPALSHS